MSIIVIGLNHKTADIELREKLAFSDTRIPEGVQGILNLPEMREIIILSTCNRVELYLYGDSAPETPDKVKLFLSDFHSVELDRLDRSLYTHTGLDAVRHVFRVASSLDSMVLGEPQILGQVKDAYNRALSMKSTGLMLNKLMKKAASVAKRVRTETKIAENAVSISYAAVELAKKIFQDLREEVFMLLGAGEMAELAARHLVNSGVKEIVVSNRTHERGCSLADEFCGRAVKFEDFKHELINTDIIICSTGAPEYVLRLKDMEGVMKERRNKPVFLIDISVPRNIDPKINNLDNVYLYDVDDLQNVVDSNLHERQREAEKADEIIDEEVAVFDKWCQSLDAVPTIIALRKMADKIKKEEMKKLSSKLNGVNEGDMKSIECAVTGIINKLIHPPTVALKESDEDRDLMISALTRLYGLNGKEPVD